MYYLVARRYAPFATFGGGFEGDPRTEATVSPTATARTIGIAAFTLGDVAGYVGSSSGSEWDGAGDWIRKIIGRHFSHVKADVSNIDKGTGYISFTLHTAGANPLVPIVAPDIVTYVDFAANFGQGGVLFTGTVRGDTFPNCEAFVVDGQKNAAMLFDFRTAGGQEAGPLRLIGLANSTLGAFSVRVASKDDAFVSAPQSCAPTMGT